MNRRYRKTIIAGNWKMNKTATETKKFAEELKAIWAGNCAEFGTLSQADFAKMVSSEIKRWAQVVKASGAKLE